MLGGLLGYEVDAIYGGGPPGIVRLAHSPFVEPAAQGAQARTRYADMTIYQVDSGALVFAAGSIQWSWGLDGYNAPAWHTSRTSGAAQRITKNVLDRMLADRAQADARVHRMAAEPDRVVRLDHRDGICLARLDLA